MKSSSASRFTRRFPKLLLVALAIVGCLFVIQYAAAYGFSRVLAIYSLTARSQDAAQKAIQLAPLDAEAHFASAAVKSLSGMAEQSQIELEHAVALRPSDYGLWSELGLLRDQMGDHSGALAAFDEAIRLAPFYSQPRWNRGNVLLRNGEYEAAFADLTQAARSNPELVPSLIDLAWSISRGDVKLTEQLAQIRGDKMRIAFARLLARRGKADDVIRQIEDPSGLPRDVRRELVDQLLANLAFKQAFAIWKTTPGVTWSGDATAVSIYDGGFEGPLGFDQGGFGWRVPRNLEGASISLNTGQPHSGSKNLRIEFSGNSNPGGTLVSQVIIVEPLRHYRINFAARSQDVVTGGLPLLSISDAGDKKLLGESHPLAKGTSDWQPFTVEFTTTPSTIAVVLSVQRENCTTSPCPIFGSISLDSFSLEQLPGTVPRNGSRPGEQGTRN